MPLPFFGYYQALAWRMRPLGAPRGPQALLSLPRGARPPLQYPQHTTCRFLAVAGAAVAGAVAQQEQEQQRGQQQRALPVSFYSLPLFLS